MKSTSQEVALEALSTFPAYVESRRDKGVLQLFRDVTKRQMDLIKKAPSIQRRKSFMMRNQKLSKTREKKSVQHEGFGGHWTESNEAG